MSGRLMLPKMVTKKKTCYDCKHCVLYFENSEYRAFECSLTGEEVGYVDEWDIYFKDACPKYDHGKPAYIEDFLRIMTERSLFEMYQRGEINYEQFRKENEEFKRRIRDHEMQNFP